MRYLVYIFFYLASLAAISQVSGCTDAAAKNYNPLATFNDGSCSYSSTKISARFLSILDSRVNETSGLTSFNGFLFTHNDSNDTSLYAVDTVTGKLVQQIRLPQLTNVDWEEIAQDADYFYIGDFGNNQNGIRKDLKIFRVHKNTLNNDAPLVDTIHFSYENQTNFSKRSGNTTDFDCEAFIADKDSLFLFTKQWTSRETSVYRLSNKPGNQIAEIQGTYDVKGLIAGASYNPEMKIVALTGYSKTLQPFVLLLYDFQGTDFFSGNRRKIKINLPFHQIEGIATNDWKHFYLSNENLRKTFIKVPAKLHAIDLSRFLRPYVARKTLANLAKLQVYRNAIEKNLIGTEIDISALSNLPNNLKVRERGCQSINVIVY